MMATDILEKGENRTHRKDDLPKLLVIRKGGYMFADRTFFAGVLRAARRIWTHA